MCIRDSPKVWPKGQYFDNLPQNILELQNDLWARVKSGQLSADGKAQDRRIYLSLIHILNYLHGFGWLTQMCRDVSFTGVHFHPDSQHHVSSFADCIHVLSLIHI